MGAISIFHRMFHRIFENSILQHLSPNHLKHIDPHLLRSDRSHDQAVNIPIDQTWSAIRDQSFLPQQYNIVELPSWYS